MSKHFSIYSLQYQYIPYFQYTQIIFKTDMQQQSPQIFQKIIEYFNQSNLQYKVLQHQLCKTSQESAKARNTPIQWGAKTMILKKQIKNKDPEYIMLIYPANRKLAWSKVKKVQIVGKKFEKADQSIQKVINVKQGGIPPFCWMFNMKGVVDVNLTKNQKIAFNAGMRTKSIIMNGSDFPLTDCKVQDICE